MAAGATVDLGAFEFVASPLDGRLGNVNVGLEASQRADVLLVNGTAGDAERVVTVTTGEAIRLELAAPPSRPAPQTSRHVTYAWIGEPDPLDISRQAFGPVLLGWTAFPTPLVGGPPQPVRLWNRFGHEPLLGAPDFPSGLAPTELFFLPGGRQTPATVTFQGYIEDDNAAIPEGVSVTNGVTLRIVP